MDGGDGLVGVLLINDDADLDLTGRDHLNVDVLVEQCLEHGGSHTGVALHASTHDGDLGAALIDGDVAAANAAGSVLQGRDSALGIAQGHGEAHVLAAVAAGGLQDDVNVDVLLGQQAEDLEGHTRHIGNILDGQNGDVGVLRHAFNEHTGNGVSWSQFEWKTYDTQMTVTFEDSVKVENISKGMNVING